MRILEKSLDFSRISISYPLQLFNPPPALTLTPNRRYSAEFKVKVIEIMRAEGLNHSEAGRRFGIESHTLLQIWEWIYLAEGPGRFLCWNDEGSSGSGRPLKRVSQDRGERVAGSSTAIRGRKSIPKKLRASVLEDEQRQRKKRG